MEKKSINNLELKAQRLSLGLSISDACEYVKNTDCYPISYRMWKYYEDGKYDIHNTVDRFIFLCSLNYTVLLNNTIADIDKFKKVNDKLSLPFWDDFEQFKLDTGNSSYLKWKIWHAVIGHLMLTAKLHCLDDNSKVPDDFVFWIWLNVEF